MRCKRKRFGDKDGRIGLVPPKISRLPLTEGLEAISVK
jgi:hypothetical protein